MRWERGRRRSANIEDRRGQSPLRRRFPQIGRGRSRGTPGGSPRIRLPMPGSLGGRRPGKGSSLTGLLLIVGIAWLMGINPLELLSGGGGPGGGSVALDPNLGGYAAPDAAARRPARTSPAEEELVEFVSFVLDDLQTTWHETLPGYRDAKLVLFRGSTPSGCGMGRAAMGPFYCPADGKVYIDLGFYDDLRKRFGAPGDFAQAYVIAHEIGHHVQSLVGVEREVRAQQRADERLRNELSVRMELQADCFAGVWANATQRRGILEPGDVEEGLRAAAAIGDDHIQQMSGREVRPESFTHGTSEQRMRWVAAGSGDGRPGVVRHVRDRSALALRSPRFPAPHPVRAA